MLLDALAACAVLAIAVTGFLGIGRESIGALRAADAEAQALGAAIARLEEARMEAAYVPYEPADDLADDEPVRMRAEMISAGVPGADGAASRRLVTAYVRGADR